MADKATPPKDLTSTLNLRQLRSIPQAGLSEDLLKSLKGAGVGARFLLDAAETKIGRDATNEIQLDDITVSRSHAMISKKDGYHIKDLGSLNGTYLNAIAVRDTQVNAGDEIQIGKYHLTLFIGDK